MQNVLLLLASYFFYGYWDYRFLPLLWISTIVDFFAGNKIYRSNDKRKKKIFLFVSIACNLSMLGFFKYYNFFYDSTVELLNNIGLHANPSSLKIILPIGISFYTFQTMSYSIDIFKGELKPTKRFIDFALFVSFFPQLVAGPIERARNLIPRIENPRSINPLMIKEGVFLIAWGLFKKIMIADKVSWIVNQTFGNFQNASSLEILIASYAFSIQVYCDFSGYSDIARGLAKTMGFELMVNFRLPYFASNMSEFWRRWHISLTTWLRDYLYFSIGGNRKGLFRTCLNTIILFTVVGLWHGSNWTYVIWGFNFGIVQALYLMSHPYLSSFKRNDTNSLQRIMMWTGAIFVFHVVSFNTIFFRAENISQSFYMLTSLITLSSSENSAAFKMLIQLILFSTPLLLMQIAQATSKDLLIFVRWKSIYQYSITIVGVSFIIIVYLFSSSIPMGEEFIYFQF
jgi:D-alanyl-lipoteichoic acid acyltransferase DltB (MBOAT superfamily)